MKILYITTVGGTMGFFRFFIHELIQQGHTVHLACSQVERVRNCYHEWGCKVFPLSCSRSPKDPGNLKAIGQIRKLVEEGGYDVVHCHTPIAAACTRLACRGLRKKGLKVFYTAHGFHFYKGAPRKNWLVYYPVEKLCARWTDLLITINQEDYVRAKEKLHARRVEYVPGVGIDVKKFADTQIDRSAKRAELGIPEDAFLLCSVGELNVNKNHQVVIRAMAKLAQQDIHYMIAGKGGNRDALLKLAAELGLADRVHLLGHRLDVAELYKASDVCMFPSVREGQGLAALEGMATGLPLIVSDNRGTRGILKNMKNAIVCDTYVVEDYVKAIECLYGDAELRQKMGDSNQILSRQFDIAPINRQMKELYQDAMR